MLISKYQDAETFILARVPIYGTADAGRNFWKELRDVIHANGLKENQISKALYSYCDENDSIRCIVATHVDDILWATEPDAKHRIDAILAHFKVGKVEEGTFRFCGKDIQQDQEGSVTISCRDACEQIDGIKFDSKKRATEIATESEVAQLRSVIGSIGWIARQCRGDLSYDASNGQGAVCRATVQDLKNANAAVGKCKLYSTKGLHYKAGAIDWSTAVLVTISDASFAQDQYVDSQGNVKIHRSQIGRVHVLAEPSILDTAFANCHIISYASMTNKRVCNSTLQAEGHAMIAAVDSGDRLRAMICGMKGQLVMKDWESSIRKTLKHMWLSDCESLVSHLKNPKDEKLSNSRLSIDIVGLKQHLWNKADGTQYEDLPKATEADTSLRWIDTSTMACDPLTKRMKPEVLWKVFDGCLDLTPTPESLLIKFRKQKLRRKKQGEEEEGVSAYTGFQ